MSKSSATAAAHLIPPTRLLVTGFQEGTRRISARRPAGTNDWLLVYTEAGQAVFRFPGGAITACADDAVLIRPGTPHDYGIDERHGYWRNWWAHFLPRPDCLDWLQWPAFAPGMMRLHFAPPQREQILAALALADGESHATGRRRGELAVNALERALLLCDSVNPRYGENRRDPRIRKAMGLLCRKPGEHVTVGGLARECGLSRSRFAELFRQQTGVPPLAFLEQQRLRLARELLEHTASTLEEIAEKAGFSSPFYLSLRFKKHYGLSPRAYRQRIASGGAGQSRQSNP
ncbi:MAG: helix-turn-helix domain-containing protein [Chthoniobacteraceae bacterium]|nr:helix-turn-helix domain-containing protein [Chthoniobacteraceae bacterium]